MPQVLPIKSSITRRKSSLTATKDSILNTKRPNVILIIWEGFTAKVAGVTGGEPNVTENFNRLSKEGVLFTNFYANGDRTDKGLIRHFKWVLSTDLTRALLRIPNKNRSLPMLTQSMIDVGYQHFFYYGGDLKFREYEYLFKKRRGYQFC